MDYVWYPDIFFIRVFLMDLIAYLTASLVIKQRMRVRRCLIVAVGSALAETVLFWCMNRYVIYRVTIYIFVNTLCAMFLFHGKTWKLWVRGYVSIVLILFFQGGIQTFWFGLFPDLRESWLWYAGMGILSGGICTYGNRRKKEYENIFNVQLEYQGVHIELQGLLDTGNCLRDPYLGQPVSVVSLPAIETHISIPTDKIRYIPYHTVGQSEKLMRVFTADKMYVYQKRKRREITKPVIGLSEEPVFTKGQIQMLLNREFL